MGGTRQLRGWVVQKPGGLPKGIVFYPGPAAPGKRSLGRAAGTWPELENRCPVPSENPEPPGLSDRFANQQVDGSATSKKKKKATKKPPKTIHHLHPLPGMAPGPGPVQPALQQLQPGPPGPSLALLICPGGVMPVLQLRGPGGPDPAAAVCSNCPGPSSVLPSSPSAPAGLKSPVATDYHRPPYPSF